MKYAYARLIEKNGYRTGLGVAISTGEYANSVFTLDQGEAIKVARLNIMRDQTVMVRFVPDDQFAEIVTPQDVTNLETSINSLCS